MKFDEFSIYIFLAYGFTFIVLTILSLSAYYSLKKSKLNKFQNDETKA